MFHEKESSQLLELNAYKIPLGALGGGRGAVATRHFGAAIAHYARRMRLPGAMLTLHRLHGRANRIHPSDGVVSRRCFAVWLTVGLVHQQRRVRDLVFKPTARQPCGMLTSRPRAHLTS